MDYFSCFNDDTSLFIVPEESPALCGNIRKLMMSKNISTILKVLNFLKKVFRIEQKPAQDHKAVKDLASFLVNTRCEEINYVRGVISYIVNYITANPENQVSLKLL